MKRAIGVRNGEEFMKPSTKEDVKEKREGGPGAGVHTERIIEGEKLVVEKRKKQT